MTKKKTKTERYSYGDSDSSAEIAEKIECNLKPALHKSVKQLRSAVKKTRRGPVRTWVAVDVAAVLLTSREGDFLRDAAKQEFHSKPWQLANTTYAYDYLQLLRETEEGVARTQESMKDGALKTYFRKGFAEQVALLRSDLKRRIGRMTK